MDDDGADLQVNEAWPEVFAVASAHVVQ